MAISHLRPGFLASHRTCRLRSFVPFMEPKWSHLSLGVGSIRRARFHNKDLPAQVAKSSPLHSFPLVLGIGGGFGGWWLSSTLDQGIHLNIAGISKYQTFPHSMPFLICSGAFSTWMIASSASRLAALQAQVRACHQVGSSVVWQAACAGGAVGVRSLCMQMLFFGAHGLTAFFCLTGFVLGFANPVTAASMLAMSLGPLVLSLPLGFLFAIKMGSMGFAAGAFVGVQLSRGISAPGVGLESSLAVLCGSTSPDASLVRFRALLASFLRLSPLLTFATVYFMYPSMSESFSQEAFGNRNGSNPDFISKRSKFKDISEDG